MFCFVKSVIVHWRTWYRNRTYPFQGGRVWSNGPALYHNHRQASYLTKTHIRRQRLFVHEQNHIKQQNLLLKSLISAEFTYFCSLYSSWKWGSASDLSLHAILNWISFFSGYSYFFFIIEKSVFDYLFRHWTVIQKRKMSITNSQRLKFFWIEDQTKQRYHLEHCDGHVSLFWHFINEWLNQRNNWNYRELQ